MEFFKGFLNFFQHMFETPTSYGMFHIVWLVFIALIATFLCVFFRNSSEKVYRRIAFIFWIIILVLEIIKQLIFTFGIDQDGNIVTHYYWNGFPYQFCSSTLYVLPFVAFLPNGKVRNAFLAFTMFFCFFGGFAVLLYPGDVFHEFAFISHQTMIHHGTQTIMGIFTVCYYRKELKLTTFLKSMPVFGAMALIAILLNEIIYSVMPETIFNMWFISSHYPSTLPVLSSIYPLVPYAVFLAMYLVGFALLAFILNAAAFGIVKLTSRKAKNV